MSFLARVEAEVTTYNRKRRQKQGEPKKPDEPVKPRKTQSSQKLKKPTKPNKPLKPMQFSKKVKEATKPSAATAKPADPTAMTFTKMKRMALPKLQQFAAVANPDKYDKSWSKMFATSAPMVMAYLLMDMGVLDASEVRNALRFFNTRVKL